MRSATCACLRVLIAVATASTEAHAGPSKAACTAAPKLPLIQRDLVPGGRMDYSCITAQQSVAVYARPYARVIRRYLQAGDTVKVEDHELHAARSLLPPVQQDTIGRLLAERGPRRAGALVDRAASAHGWGRLDPSARALLRTRGQVLPRPEIFTATPVTVAVRSRSGSGPPASAQARRGHSRAIMLDHATISSRHADSVGNHGCGNDSKTAVSKYCPLHAVASSVPHPVLWVREEV